MTRYPHQTALPCRAKRRAWSSKLPLPLPALPAPAPVDVVHERLTQWRRQPFRTKRYGHSRYPLRALLNRLLGPARPGTRKLGGPYQKVRAPLLLLPFGREFSKAAGREDITRFRTRRYSCFRCPLALSSPLGFVVVFDSRSGAHDGPPECAGE
eukprot:6212163-Pleurochrysis_carterae.AAC.3